MRLAGIGAAGKLLSSLDLPGWIVTGVAKFTQKCLADQIVAAGGDYALIVKQNQPTLRSDIEALYNELAVVPDTVTQTRSCACHGYCIERRCLIARSALRDYCVWPGLEQVFPIERTVVDKRTGKTHVEVHYGITSPAPEQADAQQLAALVRGHWRIDNPLHWISDKDLAEDASRVREACAADHGYLSQRRNQPAATVRPSRLSRRKPAPLRIPS